MSQAEELEVQLDQTHLALSRAEDSLDFYRKMVTDLGNRAGALHSDLDQTKKSFQETQTKYNRVVSTVKNKISIVRSLLDDLEEELSFLE